MQASINKGCQLRCCRLSSLAQAFVARAADGRHRRCRLHRRFCESREERFLEITSRLLVTANFDYSPLTIFQHDRLLWTRPRPSSDSPSSALRPGATHGELYCPTPSLLSPVQRCDALLLMHVYAASDVLVLFIS
jgi:hypothetical protein